MPVIAYKNRLLGYNISFAFNTTYTKDFNENQSYITDVKDIYGNTTKVKISITQIKKKVLNGIDVSVYQGTIDWTKVSKSGVDFAMIRAGYRGYGQPGNLAVDSKFLTNIKINQYLKKWILKNVIFGE